MSVFQLRTYSEIRHLLPEDCVLLRYQADRLSDADHFLLAETSVRIDHIDLDDPQHLLAAQQAGKHITGIIVLGDLHIARYVYNENTDGACSVFVQGDMHAEHIICGGQEIYIRGNLHVGQLFWGDYNHGDLSVKGDVHCKVFIDTEQYHVEIGGQRRFTHHLCNYDADNTWQELDPDVLRQLLHPNMLFLDDEDNLALARGAEVLALLQQGTALVLPQDARSSAPPLQKAISAAELYAQVSAKKIQAMLALPLVRAQYPDYYDVDRNGFWAGKYKFSFRQATDDAPARVSVSKQLRPDDAAEEDFNFYHFELAPNGGVDISYQAHNGYDETPVSIQTQDSAHIQEAYERFLHLEKHLYKANQEYLDAQAAESARRTQLAAEIQSQAAYASSHVLLDGIRFQVLRFQDALRRIGKLVWGPQHQPIDPADYISELGYCLWAEDTIRRPRLDLMAIVQASPPDMPIAAVVFAADVIVENFFSQESDISPCTVFLGKVQCKNLALFGAMHVIRGDLQCDFLYGHYNHGALYVCGKTSALAVAADDFQMHLNGLSTHAVLDYGMPTAHTVNVLPDASGQSKAITHALMPSHRLEDVYSAKIIAAAYAASADFPEYHEALLQALDQGEAVLDVDLLTKTAQARQHALKGHFERAFSNRYFTDENEWLESIEDAYHSISINAYEGGVLQSINWFDSESHYMLQAMFDPQDGFEFSFEVYAPDKETTRANLEWNTLDDALLTRAVLYRVDTALRAFLAEQQA
jgi:hypothetical protein